jgi:hypothetical protein
MILMIRIVIMVMISNDTCDYYFSDSSDYYNSDIKVSDNSNNSDHDTHSYKMVMRMRTMVAIIHIIMNNIRVMISADD